MSAGGAGASPARLDLERAALTGPVRAALRDPAAAVLDWTASPLAGGIGPASGGLYRVRGTAAGAAGVAPWSLVLKVVRADASWAAGPAASPEPTRTWGYWRREVEAYRSGLLAALPDGVAAPASYGVEADAAGARLWLEDLGAPPAPGWPLDRLARAAQRLGALNGAWRAGRLGDRPWFSRDGLRTWCEARATGLGALDAAPAGAPLNRYWPAAVVRGTRRLVADRGALLAGLDRLPQAVAHGDATPANLFPRRGRGSAEETVAVDWAFLGWMALGQEVGQLVVGSVLFYAAEPAQLRELDALAFEAYVAGLREAGWDGDAHAVRFGCAADQALRHGLFALGLQEASEALRARLRHATGHEYVEDMERFLELRGFMLDRADEARALLPHL